MSHCYLNVLCPLKHSFPLQVAVFSTIIGLVRINLRGEKDEIGKLGN